MGNLSSNKPYALSDKQGEDKEPNAYSLPLTAILNKDNKYKNKIWGKKGDKVKIISISGNAVIYEDEKGERYPCNIEDLEKIE